MKYSFFLSLGLASGLAMTLLPTLAGAQETNGDIRRALAVDNLPANFYDFEPDERYYPAHVSAWQDTTDWLIDEHDTQSERIRSFGNWLDERLSGEQAIEANNESYLRLGMASHWEKDRTSLVKPEARFRLDLPTVRRKFRLVIENNPIETVPLAQQEKDRQLTQQQRSDTGAFGAFRYLMSLANHWDLSTDIGIRLRLPPEPFWRARAKRGWAINPHWDLHLEEKVYAFTGEGWGASSWAGFSRDYVNGWHVLSATEVRWVDRETRYEWSHTFQAEKRLNVRATLVPRAGILGWSQPTWQATDYFSDLTYRYRLYKTWLYGEAIPALDFPRDNRFHANPSITLRIEVFFTGRELNTDTLSP